MEQLNDYFKLNFIIKFMTQVSLQYNMLRIIISKNNAQDVMNGQ